MNRYPLLAYLSLFSSIIPIVVGIRRKRIFLNHGMIFLFYYLVFAITADIYFTWFAKGYQFTLGLHHFYYLIENMFIMSILTVWQVTKKMRRLFQILILFYILFWAIAKITFEPLSGLYSIIACVSQILLIFSAQITLYVVIGKQTQPIKTDYHFWVLLSFILYYAGTLLIIASRGILMHYSRDILFLVTSIDWSLKIIFNILFAIAFLCPQTRT